MGITQRKTGKISGSKKNQFTIFHKKLVEFFWKHQDGKSDKTYFNRLRVSWLAVVINHQNLMYKFNVELCILSDFYHRHFFMVQNFPGIIK